MTPLIIFSKHIIETDITADTLYIDTNVSVLLNRLTIIIIITLKVISNGIYFIHCWHKFIFVKNILFTLIIEIF